MNKVILKIDGMSCSACSNGLEKYLNKQPGVISASVNLVLAQSMIEYDDSIKIEDLNRFIKEAGFESLGIYDPKLEDKKDNKKIFLIVFAILAVLTMYISMSHMVHLPVIPFLHMMNHPVNYAVSLFILSVMFLVYGLDIFKQGIKNAMHKTPNMDTLVTVGVFASFLYSTFNMILVFMGNHDLVESLYFESVTTIIFFIKLGRFIEGKGKEKTLDAIKELVKITPQNATIKVGDTEKKVTIDEVKINDVLVVRPGEKIAVDGVIISGSCYLDEAFITGESMPYKKEVGSKVLAGSINMDGYALYKAEKIGKNSAISEMVRLVSEATNTKAPIAKLADKVSGIFVPSIILIAILSFIGYIIFGFDVGDAIKTFTTILVVACPCALGLATPLAIVISEGVCAKQGILIKESKTLENAGKVNTIVFDKTGTLTFGNLRIFKTFCYSKNEKDLLHKTAAIESKSGHPISKAFSKYLDKKIKVDKFKNIPGIGLQGIVNEKEIYVGNGKLFKKLNMENNHKKDEEYLSKNACSIIYVIEHKEVIGLIGVKDIVRNDAKKMISKLKKLNKEVIMLTGDNEVTAMIISEDLGIKKVIANVMPKDKTNVIKDLIKNGKNVMMVGDGINDAPALASANIGVSINSATDIAADSSDVILTNDNLNRIISLIKISKKTIKNIKQNLFWAFFYNVLMLPIAIGFFKPLGIMINPMVASIAMMLSSLTVVFNALRLKNYKED